MDKFGNCSVKYAKNNIVTKMGLSRAGVDLMSNIQELIKSYLEENESKKIYDQIIKELQTCDKVWSAFSPITKNHFVDYVKGRPTAFLFSEKQYCQDYCGHMKESGITVGTAECSKENRLSMFADYHRSGFECIIVDNGKNYIIIELTDLINIPDYSDVKEEDRPVINPSLVCSADRFFQCMENKSVTPDKEINLLVDTYYAKYLIPIQGEPKDGTVSIPALERNDGLKVVPFFTDIAELKKFDSKGQFNIGAADYTQIESFCNTGETVVINPMGFNFTLTKPTIDAVHNAINSVPEKGKAQRAVIYTPPRLPKALVDGLNVMLDEVDEVRAGYIKGLRKDDEDQLLVVIDCGSCDPETTTAIIDDIREKASEIEIAEKVEYLAASSRIGNTAIQESQPFFERIIVDVSIPPENY